MNPVPPSPVHPALRLRPALLLLALVTALVGSSTAVATAAPSTDAAAPAGRYFPITPTRVLDTRLAGGAIANGGTRVVDLSSLVSGNAAAAVINLTVTSPGAGGYLVAYPAGTERPLASSLNFDRGQTRANSVTVAVGQGDQQNQIAIGATVVGASAQVVVDVLGYYGSGGTSAQGSTYAPLPSPVRLFDTRTSIGALTTTYPKNIGIVTLDYGSPAINRTISAAVMNITVTAPRGTGSLTIWNGYAAPPLVSTLNFVANQTVANLAVVPVRCTDSTCASVTFSIKNNQSPSTQVIGDISGVYTTPTANGLVYKAMAPTRVADTRLKTPFARLAPKGAGMTDVAAEITPDTRALNINLTAVRPMTATYLTVYPSGTSLPFVSNLNLVPGNVAANAVQVKVGRDGRFMTANAAGWTDVVIDLQGMFVIDPTAAASASRTSAAAGADTADAATGISATVTTG